MEPGARKFWQTETAGASASRTTMNSFDALGRPASQSQQFYAGSQWSQPFPTQRTYNLAGWVTSQSYPSDNTVNYNYDLAGRLADKDTTNLAFTGKLGDGVTRTYSRGISYSPFGAMVQEQLGTDTALYNKLGYNSRGQLAEIKVSTTANDSSWNRGKFVNWYSLQCGSANSVDCNATNNNGNLRKQETFIPNTEANTSSTSWSQQYDYDALNRLQRVHEYTGDTTKDWQQEYVYDRYGNRTIEQDVTKTWGSGINKKDFSVSTTNNRLGVPSGQTGTMSYDSAGNLTTDTYSAAAVTRAYDAENRMTSETQASSYLAASYTYNGDGQRVRRKVNGLETWQIYGFDGELLAEYAAGAAASGPQKEYGYRNGQLLITTESSRTNFALAASGGTASGSSVLDPAYGSYPASRLIDGTRRVGSDPYSMWVDNTLYSFPDWVEISFNGSKSIDEIDVITRANDGDFQSEPTVTQTFSNYGMTAFEVQYWNGASWVTVTNGSVTGNNKVWRQFSFSAITTSKIRVVINDSADHALSRMAEIEAWGSTTNLNWLVTDQLGTPRMIFDQSGALATTKRHDYLPFGEELSSVVGLRSSVVGYAAGETTRQKFTQKERDNETGLDYFGARYYGSTQGRFTEADPALITEKQLVNPQDLNRYAYVANNPLKFIDPDGEEKILVVITTFIPDKSATAAGRTFEGDGRNVGEPGGFRTQQSVTIETDPSRGDAQAGSFNRDTGISQELSGPGGSPIGQSAQARGETLEGRVTRYESGVVNIQAKGNEGNPLVSMAPGITYDFNIKVQSGGTQGNVTVTVTGSHDQFPAYEISVTRPEVTKPTTTTVYSYDPRQAGTNSPYNLIPGHTQTINPPRTTVIASPPPPPPPERKHGKRGDD